MKKIKIGMLALASLVMVSCGNMGQVMSAMTNQPYYQQVGLSAENTFISFKEDGTFSSRIAGTPFSGQYTFDEETQKITLKSLFLSVNCYAKKEVGGISILFEAKKLLTLLQTVSAFSGNKDLQTISDLSKKYDGVRIGFDLNK